MVTIARHFNAGLNPQNIFKSRRDDRYLPDEFEGHGGNIVMFGLPSLRDSCRCRRIPGVETPGYFRVVPAGACSVRPVAESGRATGSTLQPHSEGRRGNGAHGSRTMLGEDGNLTCRAEIS